MSDISDKVLKEFSGQSTPKWFGGMAILNRSENNYVLRADLPHKLQKNFLIDFKEKKVCDYPSAFLERLEPSDINEFIFNFFSSNRFIKI